MKKNNERTLKEAIEGMLDAYKIKHKLEEVRLIDSWERVMGKSVANRTEKIVIHNRILYITLVSATVRAELAYAKEKIIERLNEEAGSDVIDDILFR